jgi:hypothetical protein
MSYALLLAVVVETGVLLAALEPWRRLRRRWRRFVRRRRAQAHRVRPRLRRIERFSDARHPSEMMEAGDPDREPWSRGPDRGENFFG